MPLNMAVSALIVGTGLGIHAIGDNVAPLLGNLVSDSKTWTKRSYLNSPAWYQPERFYRHMVGGDFMPYPYRRFPKWMDEEALDITRYHTAHPYWNDKEYVEWKTSDSMKEWAEKRVRPLVYTEEWKKQVEINNEKFAKYIDFQRKWLKKQQQKQ